MSRPRTTRTLATLVLARLARWVRLATPVLRRGLVRSAKAGGRGLRALGRGAHRRRAVLWAAGQRAAWWSALALLVIGGRSIVGLGALPERWDALAPFVAGLVLCGGVRLLAAAGPLRAMALVLGALHGAALVLVWTAFAG